METPQHVGPSEKERQWILEHYDAELLAVVQKIIQEHPDKEFDIPSLAESLASARESSDRNRLTDPGEDRESNSNITTCMRRKQIGIIRKIGTLLGDKKPPAQEN